MLSKPIYVFYHTGKYYSFEVKFAPFRSHVLINMFIGKEGHTKERG